VARAPAQGSAISTTYPTTPTYVLCLTRAKRKRNLVLMRSKPHLSICTHARTHHPPLLLGVVGRDGWRAFAVVGRRLDRYIGANGQYTECAPREEDEDEDEDEDEEVSACRPHLNNLSSSPDWTSPDHPRHAFFSPTHIHYMDYAHRSHSRGDVRLSGFKCVLRQALDRLPLAVANTAQHSHTASSLQPSVRSNHE
jgi:hypothetical protein